MFSVLFLTKSVVNSVDADNLYRFPRCSQNRMLCKSISACPLFVIVKSNRDQSLSNDARSRGRRVVKNEFIFYQRNSQFSRSVQNTKGCKNVLRLNMQRQRSFLDGMEINTINRRHSHCSDNSIFSHFTLLFCTGNV